MQCHTEPDLAIFAATALPFLERDPVGNNNAYTVVAERHIGGVAAEPDALWATVRDDDGTLVGLAVQTPPYPVLLTDMPAEAAETLADHLAASRPRLTGVSGPVEPARAFARRWAKRTAVTVAQTDARRLYRLHLLVPPTGVAGQLREAGPDDRDLLVRWSRAFAAEATPGFPESDPARPIDARLARGGVLWLWALADGEPVSSLWLQLPVAGVVRVSGVYTPPEHRRHGYASACVAAVSQRVLDRGAVACVLNTDPANPTSNRIYQAIGYRPVRDSHIWSLRPPD